MTATSDGALRRSPLHDRHVALGARTADFGGWDMPIEYAGGGVVAEHTAVREDVGVFDVSHLGTLEVRGPGVRSALDRLLTNDLSSVAPGQAQYTLLLNESGGVVDDLIAYVRGDDDVLLVPNAANSAAVAAAVAAVLPDGARCDDRHADVAVVAVQGPRSAEVLTALGLPVDHEYMSFVDAGLRLDGTTTPVTVCRSGYTGERGYEVLLPAEAAGPLWDAVVGAGVRPCGLGARDTLRTEMGYPLHGHELRPDLSPVDCGAAWAVAWDKTEFRGRDAALAARAAGPRQRLRGLRVVGRGIPRDGMTVLAAGGDDAVGVVTSGTFSPTLKTGVALALLRTDGGPADGDEVDVDVRGRRVRAVVTRPPFVPSHVR